MERIQQIVNQQKSRCLDVESPPSNGLNLNGFINGDHNAVESSNTSVIRKVIEGTAPSAYPGFCLVTGDQENILSNNNTCARSCKSDAKAQSLRHLHDTCPKNPCVRHVSAKIDPSRQDSAKRDLLLNNAHSRRQGQELIQKYLDAVSSESVDRQADVKKQCVPPDPTKHIGFECFTSMDNQLTANPDQNEPINNNNNKNLNANKNERLVCSSTAAPLMASKSKKGIFRPHVTKSAITKCTGPQAVTQDCSSHAASGGCSTPRAHLKALVQLQREARRLERQRQIEAQKEEQARIQRNLQATAQAAAAAAAKLPITSSRKIVEPAKVVTESTTLQQLKASVPPLTSYSSEREQKLEQLLRREFFPHDHQTDELDLPSDDLDRDPIRLNGQHIITARKSVCNSTRTSMPNPVLSHQYCKKRNSMVILHKPDSAPRSPKYGKLNSDSAPKTNGFKPEFGSSYLVAAEQQHHHHDHHHHYQQQQQQDDRRWHEMNSHFGTAVTLSSAVDNLLASGDHSSRLCGSELPKAAISCQQDIEVQVSAPVSYTQVEGNALSSLTGIRDRVTHHSGARKRLSYHKEPGVSCSNRSRAALCDHATEAARLDIKLSTQRVKHMIVDSDNDDDGDTYSGDEDFCHINIDNNNENSSLSSSLSSSYYEVIKKPSFNSWRRLEAVGASESELDEDNVCIVEDIKDDLIAEPPRTSFRYAAAAADRHLHTAGVNHFVKNECARKEFWNHIYADPLRFVSVHKRQQKLLHIENRSHQQSSSGFQTNHSKRRTMTGIGYAKNGSKITSPPVHDVRTADHNVASNTSTTINSQVVTVECTESKEHGIKSHKIYSIKTKAHEFITEEKESSSQSDPHRQSSESSSLAKNYQKNDFFSNGVVNSSSQPRLPPAALNLQLTAEMNYLETLASSMQHIADMESLRHITAAQAECVSLAQLLKARELQISSKANDQVSEKETQVSGTLLINPGTNNLISSAHSSQFQGVLKAAEEFDKIERRLSVKTSHLNSLSSSRSTAESPSVRTNISDQTSVHKSSTMNNATLSDASSYDDDEDGGDMTKSDTTKHVSSSMESSSQKRNSNTDDVKSTLASVITASDSSRDSYRPSTASGVVAVNGRSATTPMSSKGITSSNAVKKHESGPQEIAQMVDFRREDNGFIKCNKNDDDGLSKKLNNNNNDEGHSKRRKSKRSMQHNERPHAKPINIPTLNLYSASLDNSCQQERSDEFNQVKYVLNKRVAALQSRRKKAEELLALSKNLELEEAEVVRLEREALIAIQSKRSTLSTNRYTEFSHASSNNSSKSGKCSKSAQWSKTISDSKHNNNNSYNRRPSTTHSTVKQSTNYIPYTDDVKLSNGAKDEQLSEAFPTASLGKSVSVSLGGGSQINVNTTSDSSSARTISSATDIQFCKSDSDSCRSAATAAASHSTRFNSHRSVVDMHQSKSTQQNEIPSSLHLSIEIADIGRGSKSTGNSISKVDNAVETTPTLRRLLPCEIGSPLDRTMTPSSRHLRQRSNSHDSGRRKRVTVPNSTDSLDDEGRMYVSGVGADDEPFSTMSANSHSDLSELESRIQALNSNLKKQESILSRINLEYKRVHKDRLARLESTLLKHRQLCTEIIANIKADLDVCKASICNESGDYSHSKSINNNLIITTADNLSGISLSKSVHNNLTLNDDGNSNENNISCSMQILDKIPASGGSQTIPDDDQLTTPTATPTTTTTTKEEETEPDTLISVAEELVSPQDTDDELNQLDLDDDDDDDGDVSSRNTPVVAEASPSNSSLDEIKAISPLPDVNASLSNKENKEIIVNCEVLKPPSSVSLSISPALPPPPQSPPTTDRFCTDISHKTTDGDHNEEEVKNDNVSVRYPTESVLIFDHVKVDDVDGDGAFQAKHATATIQQTTAQDASALMQTRNFSSTSQICSEIVKNDKSPPALDTVAHNAPECIEMSTTTAPLTPSVNGIINADSEQIPVMLTTVNNHDGDYKRMKVSSDAPPVAAYTPEVKTTSLLQIASEHRQREEVVDRITSELLMQLVSEAIRSTLNVRMSNTQTKTSDDSESDKENNLVEGSFPQQKSPVFNDDGDDEEESSDEESIPLLDLGVKLSDEDFEEKISKAAKSKIHVTPEPSYSEESVQGLFADIPERSQALIQLAVKHFWEYRSNAEVGYKEASLTEALNNPPAEFGFDYCDKIDLEIFKTKSNIRFISSTLLFDLIGELLQKIYAGEDNEVNEQQQKQHMVNHFQAKSTHRVSSAQFRLWRGPCRPTNYNHLLNIVTSEICRELNLKTDGSSMLNTIHQQQQQQQEGNKSKRRLNEIPSSLASTLSSSSRFSRLVQWTLSKKSWLDRILDIELRLDEPTWLSYVPEEREIKMKLADELWQDVLNDAVCSVIALNSCKS